MIKMKIATLGPEGTFSHEAVLKYDKNARIVFDNTIWDVFNSVKNNEVEKGIAPIENSVSGSVGMTYDALMEFDLQICGEIIIPVRHNLASGGSLKDIKWIYCTQEAFAQCEKFIREKIKNFEIIISASNSKAAEELSRNKDKRYAAIVPEMSIKKFKLNAIAKDIQNSRFNVTRFIVINAKSAKKTGTDRTSIAIYPHMDKPGLLYSLIGEFANRKINLTKIESRPSKGRLGDYIFFIDLQGHMDDKVVKDAFKAIQKNFFLKILGSYPREY
jgi:prephenate dehydratase